MITLHPALLIVGYAVIALIVLIAAVVMDDNMRNDGDIDDWMPWILGAVFWPIVALVALFFGTCWLILYRIPLTIGTAIRNGITTRPKAALPQAKAEYKPTQWMEDEK